MAGCQNYRFFGFLGQKGVKIAIFHIFGQNLKFCKVRQNPKFLHFWLLHEMPKFWHFLGWVWIWTEAKWPKLPKLTQNLIFYRFFMIFWRFLTIFSDFCYFWDFWDPNALYMGGQILGFLGKWSVFRSLKKGQKVSKFIIFGHFWVFLGVFWSFLAKMTIFDKFDKSQK